MDAAVPLRLSIVIPSWNAAGVLGACLDSLERQELEGGFETIVVDNASTDDTAAVLRRHADRVRVIANDRNVGFSAANNQAAEVAEGEILLFLNNDTEVQDSRGLERLLRAFDDPGVGLAGPMLVNPDGTLQPSCAAHPGVGRALVVTSGVHRLLPDRLLARVEPERWSHDRSRDVPWVKGAAVAVRAELFRELGGFWPRLYAEEQDLALRAQRRGARVRFERSARIMHIGNHSFAQRLSTAERAERVAGAEVVLLQTHYPGPRGAAIRAIVGGGFAARALAHRLLGHRDRAAVFRAMARVYASETSGPRPG